MGWNNGSWSNSPSSLNFKGWGYQDFTVGAINNVNVTLTANENGTAIIFDTSKIISNSAIVVLKSNNEEKAYSGVSKLFSTKVEVTAHTLASITLNAIPNAVWGDIRIYYYYDYGVYGMPASYSIAPKSVSSSLLNEIDSLFITEEELTAGTKQGNLTGLGLGTISPSDTLDVLGTARFGDHTTNYTKFESDGTMVSIGNATTWEDENVGALQLRQGATAPDFAQIGTSGIYTYYFDGINRDELVHGIIEVPHAYKEGSNVSFHIHWFPTTAGAGNVVWNLTYQWTARNGTMSGTTSTSVNCTAIAAGGTAYAKQTSETTLNGTGKDISSHLVFVLTRLQSDGSDTYGADVGFVACGIHYEKDTTGSRQITTK